MKRHTSTPNSALTLAHGATSLRLANIQALRALAVLLVVAVHIQFNEARSTAAPLLSPWLYHGVSGVDLFFVISGFIMVYIAHGKFGQPGQSKLFMLDRAARIYPPALLFTGLALLGMFVMGTADKWLPGHNILFSFLLLPQKQPPLLGVSWTLLHELYFYAVFALFLTGRFRLLPVWLLLWAGGIAFAQWQGLWGANPWTLLVFHPLTFEFIVGACVGLMVLHWAQPTRMAGIVALLIGLGLFVAGMVWIGFPSQQTYPTGWGRVLAFAPGAGLMVFGMFALETSGFWRAPKWLTKLGDWSYSLYLSHLLVISTLQHVFVRFERPGFADNLLFILLSLLAVFLVAALSYYGFERPVLHWLKAKIRRHFSPPQKADAP